METEAKPPLTMNRSAVKQNGVTVTSNEATVPTKAVPAIRVDGDKVVFNPDYMDTGKPYMFTFLGHRWFAFKEKDDTVNFYYVPKDRE